MLLRSLVLSAEKELGNWRFAVYLLLQGAKVECALLTSQFCIVREGPLLRHNSHSQRLLHSCRIFCQFQKQHQCWLRPTLILKNQLPMNTDCVVACIWAKNLYLNTPQRHQLAWRFCSCMSGNNFPYQQVAVICIFHLKRENQECGYTNHKQAVLTFHCKYESCCSVSLDILHSRQKCLLIVILR